MYLHLMNYFIISFLPRKKIVFYTPFLLGREKPACCCVGYRTLPKWLGDKLPEHISLDVSSEVGTR